MLDRAWIASRIPHQGTMCLLDGVKSWDGEGIQCVASSHRAPENPLRAHARLGAACGIEYAAQAMAVHGALLAPADTGAPRAGFLVSVRGVQVNVARLDDIAEDLLVQARLIMNSENNMLYQFNVSAAGRLLLEGRAAIVTDADALLPKGSAS
jgi:predicted hotdog family 3-hydroxylacyl-ACP dehydratase